MLSDATKLNLLVASFQSAVARECKAFGIKFTSSQPIHQFQIHHAS